MESLNRNGVSKKGGKLKSKNISQISNVESSTSALGSSNYLENEYNLVKKIITATKALEKLKTNANRPVSANTDVKTGICSC